MGLRQEQDELLLVDSIQLHITIATTGNSQDFGDMLTTGAYRNATSDSHGGLAE